MATLKKKELDNPVVDTAIAEIPVITEEELQYNRALRVHPLFQLHDIHSLALTVSPLELSLHCSTRSR